VQSPLTLRELARRHSAIGLKMAGIAAAAWSISICAVFGWYFLPAQFCPRRGRGKYASRDR
jgi:hypothetical protein